ncbi:MAG: chorismate synthase [Actinobacteria bacterium]|nr:chorismate synthase [Actinomycetota bacterium]
MRFLTAGESHGEALSGIISEYPSGIEIDADFINYELSRRQKGYGRGGRVKIESDNVKILSGVRKNKSTGSPISFLIFNKDWQNWNEKLKIEESLLNPRPGHADLSGFLKYRLESIRDVIERSSARETAARVCIGAFSKLVLRHLDINIYSYVEQIGDIGFWLVKTKTKNKKLIDSLNVLLQGNISNVQILEDIEKSPVRCPDEEISKLMIEEIDKAKKEGDTLGGKFIVIASGLPPGLGSFGQWDNRFDAKIAAAFMSIPSIKVVEIGEGFLAPFFHGREFHDEIYYDDIQGFYRKTNRAGGIEGGMSNGQPIIITASAKPIPTTAKGLQSVNIKTKAMENSLSERSDICAVPSAAVVGEAVLAIEILNAFQDKFGKDNLKEILESYNNYKKYLKEI